jgi:hypothetical protein
MFRDAHPLEVILFWVLLGVSFSLYAIVKFAPRDYTRLSTINYEIMSEESEQIKDARRDRKSSRKNTANSNH